MSRWRPGAPGTLLLPDYRWELRHLLADGQGLAARLSGAGTHTGHFHGIAATGRAIHAQELAIHRVADDKIVECWEDLASTVRDELLSGMGGQRGLARSQASRSR